MRPNAGDGPLRPPLPLLPLRIGIDGTCLASGRGYGRFLRELLPALIEEDSANEYILFVDRHTASELGPLPLRCVQPETASGQAAAASARGRRALGDMWRMGRAVAHEKLDLMYFPSVYSYFPVPGRVPVAVAFHDTIPERYGGVVFPTRKNRWQWNAKVWLARHRSRALITVSEWSRRSLSQVFGIPLERIFVTPEAPGRVFEPVDDSGRRQTWLRERGLPADSNYFITVGGFNPHKNLERLVESFAAALPAPDESWLLMVGDWENDVFHADVDRLRERIRELGLTDRVHFPGFVPDEDLRHLYSGARALLIPSLEEGFGLPAVEAAACGTPCVATSNSPLPQILEGGGLFVDPTETQTLAAAIRRLSDASLRERLARGALERAAKLSWGETARATRSALEKIARGAL